jgi:Zn-dependent metalloprotease
MRRRPSNHLALRALILVLAAGPLAASSSPLPALPAARVAELRALQPARTAWAQAKMLELRSGLGLDDRAGFESHHPFTNDQGRAVLHFRQTHLGSRVWGGEAIVHLEADGQVRTLTQGLKQGVALAGAPRLGAEQAKAIALRSLAAKGPLGGPPAVELVVFPTRFTGGLAFTHDRSGQRQLDEDLSVWARPPADPYVWAYEVKTRLSNQQDGLKEYAYVVDGNSGAILRKWNELQADSAAKGTGRSLYSGTVAIDTTRSSADGTYYLHDMTRGSLPHPWFTTRAGSPGPGLSIYFWATDPMTGNTPTVIFGKNPTNTWGDGTNYTGASGPASFPIVTDPSLVCYAGADAPSGQTAAVDALYGLGTTWDMYQKVFGRDGIDNLGTSTTGNLHNGMLDNAFWSNYDFGMYFGDGSYPKFGGFLSMTEIDIVGHELTHGVTAATANLIYQGISGGLNEATSDMLGKMVQAYATRPAGANATIPDFAAGDLKAWEVGRKAGAGSSLRFMYKPSLDGVSPDVWYEGLGWKDVHYSSGPLNRMFYFLTSGASSNAADVTYTPYLPQGMAGIGNDRAAHIYYKALTEHLLPDASYDTARQAALDAAGELYGAGSPEQAAVMNAFAGVNVGAALGQPEPPRVTFPLLHPMGSPIRTKGDQLFVEGFIDRTMIVPSNTSVPLRAEVKNASNTALTWSFDTDPLDFSYPVGTFQPDGTWLTPEHALPIAFGMPVGLIATSQQDPLRFARGYAFVVALDADQDSEVDALDMGMVAMEWNLRVFQAPFPMAFIVGPRFTSDKVADWDLAFFSEAFLNAWSAK